MLTGRDVPRDQWVDGLPPANLATTVPGIFAAGDIRSGSMKRVAAASGEGASVVPLVHAYLAPVPGGRRHLSPGVVGRLLGRVTGARGGRAGRRPAARR